MTDQTITACTICEEDITLKTTTENHCEVCEQLLSVTSDDGKCIVSVQRAYGNRCRDHRFADNSKPRGDCSRCDGSGYYLSFGTCFRCGGSGWEHTGEVVS